MRVSSNTDSNQAKFAPVEATAKPIKGTRSNAESPTSAQASSLHLNDLKGGQFASSLKANLKPDSNNQVHEEMLQAGVVKSILEQANPESAELFSSSLESLKSSGMSTEDAVKASLRNLIKEAYLSENDANLINGISFKASQLDSNHSALYDNRGSQNDLTISVDNIENAILKASEVIGAMQGKDVAPHSRSLSEASNSINQSSVTANQTISSTITSSNSGSRAGFLWKPVSESNGNLVVLLPKSLAGKVDSVSIYASPPDAGGTSIDQGRFTSNANGNRDHFRFSKPGASYPDRAYVVASLKDGTKITFQIGDSSERNT